MVASGVVLTAFMDAVASTGLSIGRLDMLGDVSATPDEFALFDIAFIAAKLTGFLASPFLVRALGPIACLRAATVALMLASLAMTVSPELAWIEACRIVQGLAAAAVLVAGQSLLFLRFPDRRQPIIQAVFALGAVMAPTTVTPALQGWLVDRLSWDWIFLGNLPVGILALVMLGAEGSEAVRERLRFPYVHLALLGTAATLLTYVLQQGSRFNWFDDARIGLLTAIGLLAAGLLVARESAPAAKPGLLPSSPLRFPDFRFGLVVSLVAGFALSGSAYLIPAFALNVLGLTATDAGALLLPSGAMLALALLLAGAFLERTGAMPLAVIPFGLVSFAGSMWLLSGSTSASGASDLMPALLLRGFGLGLLFVGLTLITLRSLSAAALPFGVGLFDFGKQAGGLLGTAALQTCLDHRAALARSALTSHITPGDAALDQRLRAIANLLASKGIEGAGAAKAALLVLQRALEKQVATIAFDDAFLVLILLFVFAAPCLLLAKRLLGRPFRNDAPASSPTGGGDIVSRPLPVSASP
jgi:DHA2 family multidrug resistance protein